MNWELNAHKGIGPIQFGMKRQQVRSALQEFELQRKQGALTENGMPSDIYDSFTVHFSKYDLCDAVTIQSDVQVSLDGKQLFDLDWQLLGEFVAQKDERTEVTPTQILSHKHGIKIQRDSNSNRATQIMCFEADHFYLYKEIPLPTVTSSLYIQVGFIEDVALENERFNNLQEGAKALFKNTREKGILLWNNLPIPFDYQEDVAEIIQKITPILREMYWAEKGDELFSVQTANLDFGWRIVWEDDVVNIDSDWRKIPGNLQEVVNSELLKKVFISKATFLAEWKMLLLQMERAVNSTKSSFVDVDAQEVVLELQSLLQNIPQMGKFYQNSISEVLKSAKNKNASIQLLVSTVVILIISFGIYWLVTGDYYYPFRWIQNNWIPLSIVLLILIGFVLILSFLVRRKKLK